MKTELIQLPRSTEWKTEEQLLKWQKQSAISPQVCRELWQWLQETDFAVDPSRAWVGELAAKLLLRDGSSVVLEMKQALQSADDWLLHFCLIALSNDQESSEYRIALKKAAVSPEIMISAHAEEILFAQEHGCE